MEFLLKAWSNCQRTRLKNTAYLESTKWGGAYDHLETQLYVVDRGRDSGNRKKNPWEKCKSPEKRGRNWWAAVSRHRFCTEVSRPGHMRQEMEMCVKVGLTVLRVN